MTMLLRCPRCEAYVQPDWPTCKICGFDPEQAYQGPLVAPPATGRRVRPGEIVGSIATLGAMVLLLWLAVQLVYAKPWQGSPPERQQFVEIERGSAG